MRQLINPYLFPKRSRQYERSSVKLALTINTAPLNDMFPGIEPVSMILLPVMINIATGSVKPEALLTHFKTKQKPINHDLQKAVKTAYLQALIETAQEFKSGRVRPSRHYSPTAIELHIKRMSEKYGIKLNV